MVRFEYSNVSFDPNDPKDIERALKEHDEYVKKFEKNWRKSRNIGFAIVICFLTILIILKCIIMNYE